MIAEKNPNDHARLFCNYFVISFKAIWGQFSLWKKKMKYVGR